MKRLRCEACRMPIESGTYCPPKEYRDEHGQLLRFNGCEPVSKHVIYEKDRKHGNGRLRRKHRAVVAVPDE